MRRIRKYADTHAHSEVRLSSVFTGVKEGDTGVGGGGGWWSSRQEFKEKCEENIFNDVNFWDLNQGG